MSRRLRTMFPVLVGAGIAASVGLAQTAGADTSVKPKVGRPGWKFVVSFKAPQTAGFVGASRVSDTGEPAFVPAPQTIGRFTFRVRRNR